MAETTPSSAIEDETFATPQEAPPEGFFTPARRISLLYQPLLELLLTPVAAARPLAHASREWLPSRAPRGGVERGSRGRLRTEGSAEGAVHAAKPRWWLQRGRELRRHNVMRYEP